MSYNHYPAMFLIFLCSPVNELLTLTFIYTSQNEIIYFLLHQKKKIITEFNVKLQQLFLVENNVLELF